MLTFKVVVYTLLVQKASNGAAEHFLQTRQNKNRMLMDWSALIQVTCEMICLMLSFTHKDDNRKKIKLQKCPQINRKWQRKKRSVQNVPQSIKSNHQLEDNPKQERGICSWANCNKPCFTLAYLDMFTIQT